MAAAASFLAEEDDLCKLAYSDAKHDFSDHFAIAKKESTKTEIAKLIPQNIACDDLSEDTYIQIMFNFGIDNTGGKHYTITDTDKGRNDYLKKYDVYLNQPRSELLRVLKSLVDSIYLIVDTKNGEFGKMLEQEYMLNSGKYSNYNVDKPLFYYIQNRQTLYDPLSKMTPITGGGKKIFTEDNKPFIQFAWEDTTPGISTQYITYPPWKSPKKVINNNFYCNSLLIQPLKTNNKKNTSKKDNKEYSLQNTHIFLKQEDNKIVVLNSDIAAKSGGILHKLVSAIKDTIEELSIKSQINELFGGNINIIDVKNTHHYIAKRLGDQGQALSACQEKMFLRKEKKIGTAITNESFESNGKHAFVTIDRLAFAAALMYQTPIVIYTPSGTSGDSERDKYDFYIHKKLSNMDTLFGLCVNEFKTNYSRLLENTESEDIMGKKTKYSDFITKYIRKNGEILETITGLITKYETTSPLTYASYPQFIKDFLIKTREIYIMNSIEDIQLNKLKSDIDIYYTASIRGELVTLLNQTSELENVRTTRTIFNRKKELIPQIQKQTQKLYEIDNLLTSYNNIIDGIDLKTSVDGDIITNGVLAKIDIENLRDRPHSVRIFEGIIEGITGSSILKSTYNNLGSYNTGIQNTFKNILVSNIVSPYKNSTDDNHHYKKKIAEKIEGVLNDPTGIEVIDDTPETAAAGGGIKELSDYFDKDVYLRSWLALYISAIYLKSPIEYIGGASQTRQKEVWKQLAINIFNHIYEQTEETPGTKLSTFQGISEVVNTTPVFYFNYFTDQIHNFPDLKQFYYKINSEQGYKIVLSSQDYKRIEGILKDLKEYIKETESSSELKNDLQDYSAYNTMVPNHNWVKEQFKAMRPMGIAGGRRRFRKTKRKNRNQKPSKKYTRRYKNPHKKSKTRTGTRK